MTPGLCSIMGGVEERQIYIEKYKYAPWKEPIFSLLVYKADGMH